MIDAKSFTSFFWSKGKDDKISPNYGFCRPYFHFSDEIVRESFTALLQKRQLSIYVIYTDDFSQCKHAINLFVCFHSFDISLHIFSVQEILSVVILLMGVKYSLVTTEATEVFFDNSLKCPAIGELWIF